MRQVFAVCVAAVVAMSFLTFAAVSEGAEGIGRSELVTVRAVVTAVDQENRMVALMGPDGNQFVVKAGDEVRNLPQVKPGDQVAVRYYQSLLVQMAKPGEQPMSTVTQGTERAMPGEMPGGAAMQQITTTATVMSVDRKRSEITLKGPEGNVVTLKAADPSNLEKVKEGDQLNITYTRAIAISVEKAKG